MLIVDVYDDLDVPRIVFTIAKATIPPSPSAEMLAWDERAGKAGKGN